MDQHRGRDQARCRQRRGMAREFRLRVGPGVAERQQLQIIGRAGQRRLQRGETAQVARDIARRVQMAQQALRPDRGQVLRRAGQMRRIGPGQGQGRLRKARVGHAGLRAYDRGHGCGRGPADGDGLAGFALQPVGPGPRQRSVVGLEGGVAPLALILHLEDVAIEAALDAPAARLMGQAGDVHEGLPRRDQRGKARLLGRAVRVIDRDRRPRDPGDRVQQREAGAVRPDLPLSPDHRPRGQPAGRQIDRQRGVDRPRAHVIPRRPGDARPVRPVGQAQIADAGRDGAPIAVADQEGQAADRLDPVQMQVAQAVALQHQPRGPAGERPRHGRTRLPSRAEA